jgi:DNA-directed RNA polymerase subunit beta'
MIMEHKGELHPQIVLEDADGKPLDVYYLPERAHIEAERRDVCRGGIGVGQDAA